MKHTVTHPMIDRVLAGLHRQGYGVEALAFHRHSIEAPMVSRLTMRFGDSFVEHHGIAGLSVDVTVALCGNLNTGQLRCWRIKRAWRASSGCPDMVLNIALTVAGDVNGNFLRREGWASCSVLKRALFDVRATLAELKVARRGQAPHEPIAIVDIGMAGGLARGRSGLARRDDDCQFVLAEKLTALFAVCDQLPVVVLEIQTVCADVLSQCERPPEDAIPAHSLPLEVAADSSLPFASSGEVPISTNNSP